MKMRVMAIVVVMVLAAAGGAAAQEGFGIGVMAGEPNAVTVKAWIGPGKAIDAAAAWSTSKDDTFQFHADYLYHFLDALPIDKAVGRMPLYLGVGGRVVLPDNEDTIAGVRLPLGVGFLFAKAPVEIFLELAPIVEVVPDADFDMDAAVGARFYFR